LNNRIALLIEYDGSSFHGWQRQHGIPTVQAAIEAALQRYSGAEVSLHCAGRTDAGVHALGQVAHVDLPITKQPHEAFRVMNAVNYHLRRIDCGANVAILQAKNVREDFHARFSALWRKYEYRLIMRRSPLVLEAGRLWRVSFQLDIAAMRKAAGYLMGRHDFSAFRSSDCQAENPIRQLDCLNIYQNGERITFEVQARAFLHNQVRIMVGTLVEIGRGRFAPEIILQMLQSKYRSDAGMTAPACGLFFMSVGYSDNYNNIFISDVAN
jgi:tRNA pseudouridine38-40 synthase